MNKKYPLEDKRLKIIGRYRRKWNNNQTVNDPVPVAGSIKSGSQQMLRARLERGSFPGQTASIMAEDCGHK